MPELDSFTTIGEPAIAAIRSRDEEALISLAKAGVPPVFAELVLIDSDEEFEMKYKERLESMAHRLNKLRS